MNKNEKIDLHIHTTYSNGKENLITCLKEAEEHGVKVISITDYNTLKAYLELKNNLNVSEYFSGEIVVGLEVRCVFYNEEGKKLCCDMLGYNINMENIEEFQAWLSENTGKDQTITGQIKQLTHYKNVAKNLGLKYDEDLSLNIDETKAGMAMIKNLLKYYDENVKIWPALARYKEDPTSAWVEVFSNSSSEFFFDITQFCPSLEDIIEKVHNYGGKVFAAHPFAYVSGREKSKEESINDLIDYVKTCLQHGVDGIECYNQYNCSLVNHGISAAEILLEYCKENDILISGGTDYHGTDSRHRGIGNLGSEQVENAATMIPYGIAEKWIEPIRIPDCISKEI